MTTNTKDITELVDEHCSSVHFTELERLLKKLDHEDLDVLRAMLEEVYDTDHNDANHRVEQRCEEYYSKGYEDGFGDGFSSER